MPEARILYPLWTSAPLVHAPSPAQQRTGPVHSGGDLQKASPNSTGWSTAKLEQAYQLLSKQPPDSLLVMEEGRCVVEWGDLAKRVKTSSVGKSLLSALYGLAIAERQVNLNSTLTELGIMTTLPLNDTERQAAVRMLLQSRSGAYPASSRELHPNGQPC
ncbi:MAG: hypothetical protein QOJ99_308 [Bryobacterales bacterium]|jgi:hypothetical protein|nr:hypothetical protein [Bryobacterales bacterium]